MMKYLRHIPINNWAIINIELIIAHTLSYESQHFYMKKLKKRGDHVFMNSSHVIKSLT